MAIQLYNTAERSQIPFKPLVPGQVSVYTCGPTVYNYAHIGNLRSYIFADTLCRTLAYAGLTVRQVMNITDVGHLTSDSDEGEDKLEKGAKREGKSPLEIARFYEEAFKRDLLLLNIQPPAVWARATEHIPEQIAMVEKLIANGYAYQTEQAVYFDVEKLADYTALSGQKLDDKQTAARDEVVIDADKKHPADFALWFKLVGHHANHSLHWPSPWGEGFPGWHIECSAMSTKYLGDKLDIHTGGVDHIAVHHTNERAQNIGALGQPAVQVWLHNEFVVLSAGEKMAKSADNFLTLSIVVERGYDPLAYRFLCLGTHYRQQLMFSWEALDGAAAALKKLQNIVRDLVAAPVGAAVVDQPMQTQFLNSLEDDLNTPQALAIVWEVAKGQLAPTTKLATLIDFDRVLGLGLSNIEAIAIPVEVEVLAEQRLAAREEKDFAAADRLRKAIADAGFNVEDTADGYTIKPLG